jgi:SH3-like domain-containing protein
MPAPPFASYLRAALSAWLLAALFASPVRAQNQAPASGKPVPGHQTTPVSKSGQPGKPNTQKQEAGPPHAPAHPSQKSTAQKAVPPKPSPQKSNPQKTAAKHTSVKPGTAAVAPPAEPKPPEPETASAEKPPEPPKGTATGLPLPRFAALRSDEVNMRAGPGTRYPIDWVYKRRDLPVEIEREFEVWRLVSDPDGTKGWVHQATLTGRRSFVVTGEAPRMLLRDPDDKAPPVAELKPGVVGHIRSCDAGSAWCQVQVGDYRGFLKRNEFWGAQPGEAVN